MIETPEFLHTRSRGLSNAQLSVLRHTAAESHPAAARFAGRRARGPSRGRAACAQTQSCTQEHSVT